MEEAMEIIIRNCAGGDVHKKFIVVSRRWLDAHEQGPTGTRGPPPSGLDEHHRVHKGPRRFSTMTQDLERLRDWLVQTGCTDIALESTGVYWQPGYNALEGHGRRRAAQDRHAHHV